MMMMCRRMEYGDLLKKLEGRRVFVWTCTTCARLCNGLGGKQSASRLCDALKADGIDVVGTGSASAGCIVQKVKETVDPGFDVAVCLACRNAAMSLRSLGYEVVEPLATVGDGFISLDGELMVVEGDSARPLSDIASEQGFGLDPY